MSGRGHNSWAVCEVYRPILTWKEKKCFQLTQFGRPCGIPKELHNSIRITGAFWKSQRVSTQLKTELEGKADPGASEKQGGVVKNPWALGVRLTWILIPPWPQMSWVTLSKLFNFWFPTYCAELLWGGVHKQGKCLALCMPIVQSQYTVIIIFPFSF